MSLKEKLLKFRDQIIREKEESVIERGKNTGSQNKKVSNYSIDKKVDDFIDWYDKNFVKGYYKGHYINIKKYSVPRNMLNVIEKMAVWYELRYPDYEVCKRYPGSSHDNLSTDNIYIRENQTIKDIEDMLDEDKEMFNMAIDELHWEDVLSPKAFISALSWDEKWFLSKPRYNDIVYVNGSNHLHLNAKGYVTESEVVKNAGHGKPEYYDFEGWYISEVLEYLKLIDYPIEKIEDIENYNMICELKERFLDIVMYRIIERGGTRIGARRGFMFALDFDRNIDIPMTYGVDYSDPGLRSFIHEYIRAGGHTDLECLVCHGSRTSEKEPLNTVTVQEMILKIRANAGNRYTEEENGLHQRLVNALANALPQTTPVNEKQEVPQKRLGLKLEKSRKFKR